MTNPRGRSTQAMNERQPHHDEPSVDPAMESLLDAYARRLAHRPGLVDRVIAAAPMPAGPGLVELRAAGTLAHVAELHPAAEVARTTPFFATAINPGEASEEKVTLSDRFGLWLGFHNCSQDEFLEMVEGYAKYFELNIGAEDLRSGAIAWQATRGSRSGRVAWQYIQDVAGRLGQRL